MYEPVIVKQTTEELIREYCGAINYRISVLIGISMLMWILEPLIYKLLNKSKTLRDYSDFFIYLYKWIGIGILFMAIYAQYILGQV